MKPVYFTRHALEKRFKEKLTEEDAVRAIMEGNAKQEGKTKFKAILRKREHGIIVVCDEYENHILVITVLKKGGG